MAGNVVVILVLLLVVGAVVFGMGMSSKSKFRFNNSMYQYGNPSVEKQAYYYGCLADECKGNTYNYDCLEKCHLKAYRRGMMFKDTADWVCHNYKSDPHAYYRCLDNVYADYRYP